MAQGKQGFGCNFQTCVNCLVCFYICNKCCTPPRARSSGFGLIPGIMSDASGDSEVNQAIVPAATGGALGDLPFIACAKMTRDEPGRPVDDDDERA
jgi:hypothetical protein